MHAIAHTQSPSHQRKPSPEFTRPNRLASALSHETHPLVHLQRTMGNQGVQRLVQAKRDDRILHRACACGASCPQCKSDHANAEHIAHVVAGITVRADVDAGVPSKKGSAAPPAQKPASPACTYKITYANEQKLGCSPKEPRGASIRYDITKVQASGKGCPPTLDGLKLTEVVKSDKGCHPQEPEIGKGCTIHADKAKPLEGTFKECTDTYSVCGDPQAFLFRGCTQILTQEVFIGGNFAEKHEIEFKIAARNSGNKDTVNRK